MARSGEKFAIYCDRYIRKPPNEHLFRDQEYGAKDAVIAELKCTLQQLKYHSSWESTEHTKLPNQSVNWMHDTVSGCGRYGTQSKAKDQ